jgi:hypothetical protein
MAARCAFCGADLRPNSMFCLACGQLVSQAGGPAAGRGGAVPVPAPVPVAPVVVPPAPVAPVPLPVTPGPVAPHSSPAASPPVASPATPPAPPAAGASSTARPAPPAVAFTLRFDTGQVLVVDGPVLVGRRPEATADERGVEGFAVDDPAKSMSRVHAGLHVDGGRLVVTDQGSGNGTLLRRGATELECEPEVPVVLVGGDVLEFGSVSATVS